MAASMSANETADKVARFMLAHEGTGPAWGVAIDEAREGYARISMRLRPDMMNGHRTAHGGMVFALADTAFAYACNSRNVKTVAAQASIIFLDAVRRMARRSSPKRRSRLWPAARAFTASG
jgi:acyl-CoA thioesterase